MMPVSESQELDCEVQVIHRQIQGSNVEVFNELQEAIYEFMNETHWTDHVFSRDERIDCNLMINLTEKSGDAFTGTITIQARRPVYNSNYTTVLLNHKEEDGSFQFSFQQGQSLDFSLNSYISNLTSVLAYYAYLIIGLDYDSFSLKGGTPFFRKAQTIVNNAQSQSTTGWKAYENRTNRYWIIENMTNDIYSPLRIFSYRYHRLGFDVLNSKLESGRSEISQSFKLLQQVYKKKPNSITMDMLFNAKTDEIIKLFSGSSVSDTQKKQVYNTLKEISPSNAQKLKDIID